MCLPKTTKSNFAARTLRLRIPAKEHEPQNQHEGDEDEIADATPCPREVVGGLRCADATPSPHEMIGFPTLACSGIVLLLGMPARMWM